MHWVIAPSGLEVRCVETGIMIWKNDSGTAWFHGSVYAATCAWPMSDEMRDRCLAAIGFRWSCGRIVEDKPPTEAPCLPPLSSPSPRPGMLVLDFNLNHHVYVHLTEYGHKALRRYHDETDRKRGRVTHYHAPKEDKDGYSQWQLWVLMEVFGPMLHGGMNDQPFFTNIKIEVTAPKS